MGGLAYPGNPLGGKLQMQLFTANGVFTPSANLIACGGFVQIYLGGGGGGGGGCDATGLNICRGCGGGAGGEILSMAAQILAPVAITIGGGGIAGDGATGAAGGDGEDTIVTGIVTARGGGGGNGINTFGTAGKYASGGGSSGAAVGTYSTAGGGGASFIENGQAAVNENLVKNMALSAAAGPPVSLTTMGGTGQYGAAPNSAIFPGRGGNGIIIPEYGAVGGGGSGGHGDTIGIINGQIPPAAYGAGRGGYPGTAATAGKANKSGGGGGGGGTNGVFSGAAGGSGFVLVVWMQ